MHPICTPDGRALSNLSSATVSGTVEHAGDRHTGITGEAGVGETLTTLTADIEDTDGLSGAAFAFQWLSVDGGAETDIAGATAVSYTLADSDVGLAEVPVAFYRAPRRR